MQNRPFKIGSSIIIAAISVVIIGIGGIIAITGEIRALNPTTSEPAADNERSGGKSTIAPFILEKLASAQRARHAKRCDNCGVVDSIIVQGVKEISSEAGPVTGHKIEKSANNKVTQQVKLRMDNGTYRVVAQQDKSVFHVGDKVKIVNGVVVHLDRPTMTDNSGMFALMLTAFTSRRF